MSDAPKKHAVEAATLVLVEMLRSENASRGFFTGTESGEKAADEVIEAHRKLIEHFEQFPDFDAEASMKRLRSLSS